MPLNLPSEQYKEISIFTAGPEELTLMLFQGLVKFIMQALLALEEQNVETAHNCIVKAKRIVVQLENTLDMDYPVSESFLLMYELVFRRLTEANVKKDKGILEETLGFAKDIRDTWYQAMRKARSTRKAKA